MTSSRSRSIVNGVSQHPNLRRNKKCPTHLKDNFGSESDVRAMKQCNRNQVVNNSFRVELIQVSESANISSKYWGDFDVLCIQGAANHFQVDGLKRMGIEKGLLHNRAFQMTGERTLVVSRFPIVESSFTPFSIQRSAHRNDGICLVRVFSFNGVVDVFAGQFSTKSTRSSSKLDKLVITAQIFQTSRFIRLTRRSSLVLFMGKFPAPCGEAEYGLLKVLTGFNDPNKIYPEDDCDRTAPMGSDVSCKCCIEAFDISPLFENPKKMSSNNEQPGIILFGRSLTLDKEFPEEIVWRFDSLEVSPSKGEAVHERSEGISVGFTGTQSNQEQEVLDYYEEMNTEEVSHTLRQLRRYFEGAIEADSKHHKHVKVMAKFTALIVMLFAVLHFWERYGKFEACISLVALVVFCERIKSMGSDENRCYLSLKEMCVEIRNIELHLPVC
mmetsp:Transcript_3153/g.4864  ORF Transcript_3153/g.4864 Transcript_3153/m.4864 type:complete len:441 (+) Transcript_3153:70-1392(+)